MPNKLREMINMLFDELIFEIRRIAKESTDKNTGSSLWILAHDLEKNGIEDEHFPEELYKLKDVN